MPIPEPFLNICTVIPEFAQRNLLSVSGQLATLSCIKMTQLHGQT